MSLRDRMSSVLAFLRAGYPMCAPEVGYAPLLALLPRRVSDDELVAIVGRLLTPRRLAIDTADVGVKIIGVTDEMPSIEDIERVQAAMQADCHDG
jgi:uncharacterized protein DUF3349